MYITTFSVCFPSRMMTFHVGWHDLFTAAALSFTKRAVLGDTTALSWKLHAYFLFIPTNDNVISS